MPWCRCAHFVGVRSRRTGNCSSPFGIARKYSDTSSRREKAGRPEWTGSCVGMSSARPAEPNRPTNMQFEIRTAIEVDLDELREILSAAGLSTLEILDPGTFYWVASSGGRLVGTCGLELDGKSGLVRSVAVSDEDRRKGIGEALLVRCIDFAKSHGLERLYLFSKDTGEYFLRLGWRAVSVASAADALRAAPQVRRYERVGWYADERAFVRPV